MKALPLLSVLMVSLSGCAGPTLYEKAGATTKDFENDKYDCEVQMDQSSGAIAYRQDPLAHMHYLTQVKDDMARCLKRKGWTEQVAPQQ